MARRRVKKPKSGRVSGLGFRASGLGFRVLQGLRLRVSGPLERKGFQRHHVAGTAGAVSSRHILGCFLALRR